MSSSNVYSISEIAGSSPDGVEAAIGNALGRARKTLRR
jgi:flavin-binding protein dodecin